MNRIQHTAEFNEQTENSKIVSDIGNEAELAEIVNIHCASDLEIKVLRKSIDDLKRQLLDLHQNLNERKALRHTDTSKKKVQLGFKQKIQRFKIVVYERSA